MKPRIVTARDQFDMLSPWMITAAPDPTLFSLGNPEMDFAEKEIGPQGPKGKKPSKPPLPKALPATPDGAQLEIPYWQGEDWRTGDGGLFHSKIRPQIPEVDVPHPSEYMSPEKWEKQKAKLKEPDYDPHGVLPDNVWFEDLVKSEMSHLNNHTAEEGYEGRGWYPGAHDISKNLSDKTSGDHERTVAEWAAVSPNNFWDNNVENGYQFGLMYPGRPGRPYEETAELHGDPELAGGRFPMPALGPSVDDAQRIRHAPGKSFMDYLTGPKRQSFFRNIMDKTKIRDSRPGQNPVDDANHYENPINPFTGERDWRMHSQQIATMDTQHHRMTLAPHGTPDEVLANMEYKTEPWFGKKRTIDGPNGRKEHETGYELQHRAHWEAVRRYNAAQEDPQKHINPSQAQAIAWLKFRHDINRAVEKKNGKKPKVPGALPKGVEPGRYPQKVPFDAEGPEEEYFSTGERAPLQDSQKNYNYQRFQRDHSYDGDPDYNKPPKSPGPNSRYLEMDDRYNPDRPQKQLPGRRPVIDGTGSEPTPNDPRNYLRDLRRMRNWDRRANRFWQRQADAPRVLYRGIHLNPHVKPGQTGYIPPELYATIRQHGLTSKQFADAFAQSTWGTRFSPMKSVAESFAMQAPPGVPSAVIAVDWDGNDRAADPHAEMSQFPDSWFGGTRPQADPDPFQEVRLKPGKQLKVRSLQVRSPEQGQWKELLNGGPTVIRTATVHESGIQDNKYPQHWIDKADQLAKDTGGFTIHDDPTTPGDAPSSGYQVAIPGHDTTDVSTGQGWADWAKENNALLSGAGPAGGEVGMGTWFNPEDSLYYTEPSENLQNYDNAARATVDRDQWSMWDNSAFRINPQTGEKEFLSQADIPRTDIAQQGIANSLGFTMAKNRGITYRPVAFKQVQRFWEG